MRARLLLALSLFLLLAGAAAGYYLTHKPITPDQAAALGRAALDAAPGLGLTLLAGGLGRRLLADRLPLASLAAGERCLLEAALGWGALGLAMLGLGLAGWIYAPLVLALALGLGLLLWRPARAWLSDLGAATRALWTGDGLARWAAICLGASLGLGLLRALAPPLMWDALVYHLTLPKLYAEQHSLRLPVDLMFSGMPQLNEMLYLMAYVWRGASAAQALGWCFGAMLAVGLAAHTGALLGEDYAAPAAGLLFSAVSLALALAWAYAELLLMVMALALLICLRQWRLPAAPGAARRWLALAGVCGGLAMGCKYTGVIAPAAAGLVIMAGLGRRIASRAGLRDLAAFAAPASLAVSPWLIKNAWFTGNPFYPLAFPAAAMDGLRLWFYNRPDLAGFDPLIFLRAIFQGVQGGNALDASLGPAWVVLPATLALGWRRLAPARRAALRLPALFTLAAYAGWVALTPFSQFAVQARLFFAFFPALAGVCAGGLAALPAFDLPALRISRVVRVGVGLFMGLGLLEIGLGFLAHNPLPYLTGRQSAGAYRADQLGWYAPALERVNALPAGSRVLFLWEARSLECAAHVACWPDVIIDRWWHARRTLGGPDAILAEWRRQGFTHLLLAVDGAAFVRADPDAPFPADDWQALAALRARLSLAPGGDLGGAYALYSLTP